MQGQKFVSRHNCYENLTKYYQDLRDRQAETKVLRLFSTTIEQYSCKEESINFFMMEAVQWTGFYMIKASVMKELND